MTEWAGKYDLLGVKSMTAGDFEGTGVDSYIDFISGFRSGCRCWARAITFPYGHVDMRGVEGFEFLNDTFAFKIGDPQLTRSKVLGAIKPYL
ncbi:hypothetical protein P7H19_21765 [Paenibacillus larvae]|nr:hypothetical protein [Paenibacillus larvae]MDT2238381.1 hypothetical protein [Paenibacillus larvae]